MSKTEEKKVVEKKLIGFTKDSLEELKRLKRDTKRNQTQIVNDLLSGKDTFIGPVEDMISAYQKETGRSRHEAIQALILEGISGMANGVKPPKR